jgi:NAD(P)-dependent dehydrogenase (short-subunit alcohol dehydrogenase family)
MPAISPTGGKMTLFDLTGKTAVITGSTKGIGKAIAERLAEHGARVVISSRKADACDRVAADINAKYGKGKDVAVPVPCNINYKEQLEALVGASRKKLGRIDILVCNAALNPYYGPSKGIPDEAFDKILGANIRSNHWLSHMVLPEMVDRKDGVIIVVSSIGGLRGSSVLGTYAISKAADMQLARKSAPAREPRFAVSVSPTISRARRCFLRVVRVPMLAVRRSSSTVAVSLSHYGAHEN